METGALLVNYATLVKLYDTKVPRKPDAELSSTIEFRNVLKNLILFAGKTGSVCLVTITDRCSRYLLAGKVTKNTQCLSRVK